MLHWILDNPEIQRHLKSGFKKRRFVGSIVLYLLSLLLIAYFVFEGISLDANPQNILRNYGRTMFFILLGIQYFATFFVGSMLCAGTLVREKEMHAYDFLRIIPLHPLKMVIGKLIGTPILIYILMLITLPLTLLSFSMAQLPLRLFLSTHFMLLIAGLFTHALGLFISAFVSKSQYASSSTLVSILILGGVFSVPQIAFMHPATYFIMHIDDKTDWLKKAFFFGFQFPPEHLAGLFYTVFIAFCLIGIYRHLESESLRLLSKKQALSLYGVLLFLITGLFWDGPRFLDSNNDFDIAIPVLFMSLFSILLVLIYILTPSFEGLTRWMYMKQEQPEISHWDGHAPLGLPILIFYGLTFLQITVLMSNWPSLPIKQALFYSVFLLLFIQVYLQLFQLIQTWYTPFSGGAIGFGFILLTWFIPIFGLKPQLYFFLNPYYIFGYISSTKSLFTMPLFISSGCLIVINVFLFLWVSTRMKQLSIKVSAQLDAN